MTAWFRTIVALALALGSIAACAYCWAVSGDKGAGLLLLAAGMFLSQLIGPD